MATLKRFSHMPHALQEPFEGDSARPSLSLRIFPRRGKTRSRFCTSFLRPDGCEVVPLLNPECVPEDHVYLRVCPAHHVRRHLFYFIGSSATPSPDIGALTRNLSNQRFWEFAICERSRYGWEPIRMCSSTPLSESDPECEPEDLTVMPRTHDFADTLRGTPVFTKMVRPCPLCDGTGFHNTVAGLGRCRLCLGCVKVEGGEVARWQYDERARGLSNDEVQLILESESVARLEDTFWHSDIDPDPAAVFEIVSELFQHQMNSNWRRPKHSG